MAAKLEKMKENVDETLEGLEDVSDDLNELKGFLSEALGDVPFKCAVILVVFFSFIYIFYGVVFANRISDIINSDCYCDPTDRVFYRTVILMSIVFWVCFLSGYAIYTTFGHGHCIRHNEVKLDRCDATTKKGFTDLYDFVKKQEKIIKLS